MYWWWRGKCNVNRENLMRMNSIGVIGAGTMGSGIAHVAILSGFKVHLIDLNPKILDSALHSIRKNMDRQMTKNKITENDKTMALENLMLSSSIKDCKNKGLIIEAVSENYEIKSKIFKELDNICSAENYFISNNNIGNNQKIDDLLLERSKKIKLIKIDTDGYDFECLCGSEQLIKQQFPLIIIEMTENNNKIHQKLINIGYQYFYNQHYKEILNINYPPNLIASVKPLQLIPID